MVEKWKWTNGFSVATCLVMFGVGIFNFNYFDIGRTEDAQMSAANLYHVEFAKIPDGAIFMPNYAWEWEAIYKYNADYGKHIYPICIDILPSELYRDQLQKDGIKFIDDGNPDHSILANNVARSIVALNDNVWTTVSTDPSTFRTEVVSTNHNPDVINYIDVARLKAIAEHPIITWKPYNPYDVLTTSITVEQWKYVLLSNRNVMFYLGLGSVGFIIVWFMFRGREKHEHRDAVETKISE